MSKLRAGDRIRANGFDSDGTELTGASGLVIGAPLKGAGIVVVEWDAEPHEWTRVHSCQCKRLVPKRARVFVSRAALADPDFQCLGAFRKPGLDGPYVEFKEVRKKK